MEEEKKQYIRPRLYVDLDGVIVDLGKAIEENPLNDLYKRKDLIPGLFKDPDPIPNAVAAFKKLKRKFDVYILSTAPWDNPDAWTHKRKWVEKYLGKSAYKRLILSHHKNLLKGDYLIDDRTANGAGEFEGELIQFGQPGFEDWNKVLAYLGLKL